MTRALRRNARSGSAIPCECNWAKPPYLAKLTEQRLAPRLQLAEAGMALQPGSEGDDIRRMAGGPALAMEQRAMKLLDLAAGVGRAGIAAQQPASRHKRLGVGGFEHDTKSQDYGIGQRRQQRSKRAASP